MPKIFMTKDKKAASEMLLEGASVKAVATKFKVHVSTIYALRKDLGHGYAFTNSACRNVHVRLCILPEGHRSNWEITTPFRFIHLYMPNDRLRSIFAAIHDRDARQLDLPEVTFAEMPGLAGPLNALAQAAMTGDRLLADTGLAELIG